MMALWPRLDVLSGPGLVREVPGRRPIAWRGLSGPGLLVARRRRLAEALDQVNLVFVEVPEGTPDPWERFYTRLLRAHPDGPNHD